MIVFARHYYLFLLWLVLLLPAVYALVVHLRNRRMRRFGDWKLVLRLMPSRKNLSITS